MRNHANREPHEGEDWPHPTSVAASEVVVDGDHVHTSTTNSVDGGTERSHKRLSFTGAHLRDLSLMEHDRTQDLCVVRAHAGGAARCLTRGCENLWQLLVERRL